MEIHAIITKELDGTILAVQCLIPFSLDVQTPSLIRHPFELVSLSVPIGMTGDIRLKKL
ncbi:hypothetical protein IOC57_20500 [Bacillus sp. SD075]|uniref:hypothetical protein n=1 Tax=Bacillus sp. SD075 TaxID=2781732 RepID=UPI001A9737C5|nr:hypothetical protein [Bacillus sp. SD075]MBO1000106.1 hypothetical protein [Bacillus sp. SD075]